MTCKRQDRTRHNTIAFWLSDEEKARVDARIKLSGLPKGEYYRSAVLGQEVQIVAGKYLSDRLAAEIKKIRTKENPQESNIYELKEIVEQLLQIWSNKKASE